ncbi:MAG: hypothetical protein AYP45_03935 [Candidatus Brocadia carolinensis]|uniref:Uncharacterized protein n=1 Tax=Candidatus Brocadia carolinensis TaxID=1004156 RepID=A0A1V4AW08_9BACT|nr:MAG: hypothetical protein AYP45_03935 [Candidatus Brocadia caroliniensis]
MFNICQLNKLDFLFSGVRLFAIVTFLRQKGWFFPGIIKPKKGAALALIINHFTNKKTTIKFVRIFKCLTIIPAIC